MLKLTVTLVILSIYNAHCDVRHIVQPIQNEINFSLEKPQSPLIHGTSSDYILASPSLFRRIQTKPDTTIRRSSVSAPQSSISFLDSFNPPLAYTSTTTRRPLPPPPPPPPKQPQHPPPPPITRRPPLPPPPTKRPQYPPTRPPTRRPLLPPIRPLPTRPSQLVPRQDARILRQNFDIQPAGNYHQSFESDNGISVQERGDIRQLGPDKSVLDVSGSYSYTAPDGTLIELSYIANENGFQPQGAHIPTPPPIPIAIQRALEYIKNHPYVDKYSKK